MAKYRINYYKEDYIEIEASDCVELRRKALQCAPFDYDYYEVEDIDEFEGEDGVPEEAPEPDSMPTSIGGMMVRKMIAAYEVGKILKEAER